MSARKRRGPAKSKVKTCRHDGCDVKVLIARNVLTNNWGAYEAQDRRPFSDEAAGCYVILPGWQAWKPRDLVEDWMVRNAITEEAARALVAGQPWHRPHFHISESETSNPIPQEGPA